jgi:hypothetical protein
MAAAKGNKNAIGNSGGKSLNDRKLAAEVRSLALGEIKAILDQDGLTEMKKAIILKLAPSLLPRLNEHTGNDGEDLFPVPILANMNVPTHDSNNQDSPAPEAD